MDSFKLGKTIAEIDCLINFHEERENTFTMSVLQTCREYVEELKRMKDAEEQGLLLRFPCPIGTMVYNTTWWDSIEECVKVNGKPYFRTERKYKVSKSTFSVLDIEEFGKTVFLTREEAESALAEKGGV